jgi:peptide chain release factor 1
LEKNEISQKISNKKKNLLLINKQEYEKADKAQEDYQELIQQVDQEEQKLFLEEIKNLQEQKNQLIAEIKEQIIEEEGIKQNIVMEIRPGTGGTEAGLFARDLYRMYYKFAERKQ